MRSRWIVNLILLALVAGIVSFLYLRPKPVEEKKAQQAIAISNLKIGGFSHVSIEFPARAGVEFEKIDGYWHIVKPFKARADQMAVQRILAIVAAESNDKFPATDLGRYGLDQPKIKVKLDNEEFLFGTYNPVSSDQYVAYKDAVYLVSSSYSDFASVQVEEAIDKNLLKPTEKVAGFDFSRLEQWESVRLNVDIKDGKWTTSVPDAKLTQNDMNEWFDTYWKNVDVKSVEPYTPDRKASYASFEVKLQDGSKVHFDRIQEAPEVILGRPDEGMMYHLPADFGFTLLNPPVTTNSK
ncbi:DUF4340 domain-containing protein [Methylovorus glucosotrophus]|jgi:hypothetical protein|uniref:DUF4340 domain-containing protein n=1 Tax=Methylovorus glucosotrophus (strain SIP3-4) TaxID=582744 RepID=C6X7R9_METGS|nr:DUF4340 domain-containing protein [Methylovorus glucosotrophus]ACT51246.1 conserved hypothetical protein [Methylovorus glucosotrophus SIP3-4]KAF0843453.1 uncharacterized protein DUF4340 [Methylovorus glucosotrophus]